MSTVLFLAIRVAHVLLAAIWVGTAVFISMLLMPAIDESGPAGGQVMMRLNRKGIVPFFGVLAGTTVLTGIFLFWRFTGGFDPAVSRSHAGMAYGIGGAAGILAAIVGGSVVGRNSKKLSALMEQAMGVTEGAQRGALLQQADVLRQRVATGGLVVIALQVIALVTMAVAHYI